MIKSKSKYILMALITKDGHLSIKGPVQMAPHKEEEWLFYLSKDPDFFMAWFFSDQPHMSDVFLCMAEGKGVAGHKLCTGVIVNGNLEEVKR